MASQVSQSDLERRAAELAQRSAAAPAESWRPDKPEERHPNPIIGVLLRVKAGGDRGYGPTMIAQLRAVDDTVWDVWLLGEVLEREFDPHAEGTVRPGDMVAITFEGKKPKKSGDGSYRSYRVEVAPGADPSVAQAAAERPVLAPFAGHEPELDVEGERGPPAADARITCPRCGFFDGNHMRGCPEDQIPF